MLFVPNYPGCKRSAGGLPSLAHRHPSPAEDSAGACGGEAAGAHPQAWEVALAEPRLPPRLDLGKSTWAFRNGAPAYNVVFRSLHHRDTEKTEAFDLKRGAPANKTDGYFYTNLEISKGF